MGNSYYITYGGDRVTYPGVSGSVAWKAPNYVYKELWHADSAFRNMYSITLNDSIDNYDEYIVYGSAMRAGGMGLNTRNRYVVVSGSANMCGCYYAGKWDLNSTFILVNGTEMTLSGTSGYIGSSYFFGQNNNSTAWVETTYNTARTSDLHPYKIVGVKEVK